MTERQWRRPGEEGGERKNIEFKRPSQLAKDGFKGVLVEGTFVESFPNKFDENKLDYNFIIDTKSSIPVC